MKPRDPELHFQHLKSLLELEEKEELRLFQEEFISRSPEERQLGDMALLYVSIAEIHYSPAGHRLISFHYHDGRPLPFYAPETGDVLCLSRIPEEPFDGPTGTVYDRTPELITVALDGKLPDWFDEGGVYHLAMTPRSHTYRKMNSALRDVAAADHNRLAYFRDLSLGLKKPATYDSLKIEGIHFFNSSLNAYQKEAAAKAMASQDVFIVHGPPGTGKTTVLIEIIRQAVSEGKFVYAVAPSNTACDHILECLVASGVAAMRLGHPARIMEHLRGHTMDFKLAMHPLAKEVESLEGELDRIFLRKERHKGRREFTFEERETIQQRVRELKHEIKEMERLIFDQVVKQSSVMVGTLVSALDPVLKSKTIDLLIMDEASQATEPMAWIPILKANKVILAGDHFQLPPTVRSKEAEKQGLTNTLFERWHNLLGADWKSLLRVQYRMHEKIMSFSSREFYEDRLIADDSVKDHTLADMPEVQDNEYTRDVFQFLDTAGMGFEEKLEKGSESRYNPEEAELVIRHLRQLLGSGIKPEQIAIISPYSAQVRWISSKIQGIPVEVDSVDGFQGREKEAVLLSLVRSNVEGEMGFLTDVRRMNVAMTRAKRKLIVIGDSATLGSIPFYRDFIQYAEAIGGYKSAWENPI